MPKVFVYGPDSLQARMYDRLGSSNAIGGARLSGYALRFNKPSMKAKGEGLANAEPEPGSSVYGVLYDLTKAQLDMLEGYYGGYGRKTVTVELLPQPDDQDNGAPSPTKKEPPAEAIAFFARRTAPELKPSPATIEASVKGAKENGAPSEYIASIEKTEAING